MDKIIGFAYVYVVTLTTNTSNICDHNVLFVTSNFTTAYRDALLHMYNILNNSHRSSINDDDISDIDGLFIESNTHGALGERDCSLYFATKHAEFVIDIVSTELR